MTIQEAVRLINNMSTMCEYVDAYGDSIDSEPYFEAVNMAIEALQQGCEKVAESCDDSCSEKPNRSDLISRQDIYDLIDNWDEPMISKRAFRCDVEDLPSAQPETSEWTEKEVIHKEEADKAIEAWQSAKCSKCGCYHTTPYLYYFTDFAYCPNCGRMMRGETE